MNFQFLTGWDLLKKWKEWFAEYVMDYDTFVEIPYEDLMEYCKEIEMVSLEKQRVWEC